MEACDRVAGGGPGPATHQTLRSHGVQWHPAGLIGRATNRDDAPLLCPDLAKLPRFGFHPKPPVTVNLDAGCDSGKARHLLMEPVCDEAINISWGRFSKGTGLGTSIRRSASSRAMQTSRPDPGSLAQRRATGSNANPDNRHPWSEFPLEAHCADVLCVISLGHLNYLT